LRPQSTRQPTIGWLLFSPSGRCGRQTFALGWLFWMMVNSGVLTKLLTAAEDDPSMGLWSTVFFATFGLSAISTLMLTIKRVHDLGLPGVMALSIFVPGVSLVVLVLLCVWPTTDNADRYGARRDWPAG